MAVLGRAHGYGIIVDPTQLHPVMEFDTKQCVHCGGHIRIKPGTGLTVYLLPSDIPYHYREENGCWCGRCMGPECLTCHATFRGACRPFELWLDQQEGRVRRMGWGPAYRLIGRR